MSGKIIKRQPKKWTPKHRWIESFTINLKTGKTKYKYFFPKTPEEENKLEAEFDRKMEGVFDTIFQNIQENSSHSNPDPYCLSSSS